MRTRLLFLLFSTSLIWFGVSVYRASDQVQTDCESRSGTFIYAPHHPMQCVTPARSMPATSSPQRVPFPQAPLTA